MRFETPPGQQLQIDFGSTACGDRRRDVGPPVRGHAGLLAPALRWPFLHERQSAWLEGLEGAFRHFGGVPERSWSTTPGRWSTSTTQTREVVFNDRFLAFCRYWGVQPRACAPYRARTKGKDERGVGYVKRNAIAGHRFASMEALEAHLVRWMREVADTRAHGTTGEPPLERFERAEAAALRPLAAGAVPAGARTHPPCARRRLHRGGHQPLQRAVATDRRDRHGRRQRAPCGCCTPARRSRATPEPAATQRASSTQPPRGHRRRAVRRPELAPSSPRTAPTPAVPRSCCVRWSSTKPCSEEPGDGRQEEQACGGRR